MTKEEAIDKVRAMKLSPGKDAELIIALHTLIPELRESEDERIRRTLVEYFGPEVQLDFVRGVPTQKIRDWLEKQKSNNSDEIINFKFSVGDVVCRKGRADHTIKELFIGKEPVYICTNDEGLESHIPYSEQDEWELKQKEQKQTDLPSGFYYIDLNGNRYYSKEFRYGDMKLKVGEQKPAEWSEKYIAGVFEKVGLAKIVREQGNNALTNALQDAMLELSKVEKAEWSEEDKTIINVLRLAVVNSGEALFRKHEITKQECIDFVNSLRPSWKPSEEQTEALQRAIDACECEWAYQDDELRSLLNDLKKL